MTESTRNRELVYNAEFSTYRNRLDELKSQAINELLQGQSEAFNREIILTELKKHCITSLAKEWDYTAPTEEEVNHPEEDDLISNMEPWPHG